MPIYPAPLVSSRPVFGFGQGDLFVVAGPDRDTQRPPRWLLVYKVEPGAIGSREETARMDGPVAGTSTRDAPADLALYFAKEESVDQVIAELQIIKASFAATGEEDTDSTPPFTPTLREI